MMWMFDSAEQALCWSVEVLRRRRLPQLSSVWREVVSEAEYVAQVWEGQSPMMLGMDSLDRLGLALKVEQALERVAEHNAQAALILRLWAWGDWADEGRLRAALAIQEKCRREGMRVRMAYRYTYAQLAMILACDRKGAWRRVQDALDLLGRELVHAGVLSTVVAAAEMVDEPPYEKSA